MLQQTSYSFNLHSDGTSKFGEHYGSYQSSTEKSVYFLGLCEMLTGSAELTLHTFKQIINDLDLVARKSGDVVSKIKNTMHIVISTLFWKNTDWVF